MTADNRREHRARVLKRGLIVAGSNRPEIACAIRNMHSHGAELKILPEDPVPGEFLLYVPHDGVTYRCVLRWRRNDRCGVEFTGTQQKPRGTYG